ncbi:hypothetical protein F5Y01DRAFT_279079 [Xylaria sp. FL0043]|nr:hypothetical protein F5Y01DRAFT_279079 [Xylaria sp. FL0043]
MTLWYGMLGLLLVRHLFSFTQALMRHPAAFQAHYYRRLQIEIIRPLLLFLFPLNMSPVVSRWQTIHQNLYATHVAI